MRKLLLLFITLILPDVFSARSGTGIRSREVIAFVADTQAPMWFEGIYMHEDNNPEATRKVMSELLRLNPSALFMLGDVVNIGPSIKAWSSIGYYLKQLEKADIPFYGLLGNHELFKRPAKGERNFQHYFPDHVRTGYLEIVDSVAVLLMNSNPGSLNPAETKRQFEWYNKALSDLDRNSAVKSVIVTCHHSPFTNSKLVSPSNFVQENFVPGFISSEKAILFLSGHAHRFEHFMYEGKDFLVIGGGGGLNHPARKKGVRFPDLAAEYKPSFHYLTVERTPDSLVVQSHFLLKDFSGFEKGRRLSIALSGRD